MSNPLFGNPNQNPYDQADDSNSPAGYPHPPQNPNNGTPSPQQAPQKFLPYQVASLPPRPQRGQNPNHVTPQQPNGYPQQGQQLNYGMPHQGNGYEQQEGYNPASLKNRGWSTKKKTIVIVSSVAGALLLLVVGLFVLMAVMTGVSGNASNTGSDTPNDPTISGPVADEPVISSAVEQDANFRLSLGLIDTSVLTFEEAKALAFESCALLSSEEPMTSSLIELVSGGNSDISDELVYERSYIIGAGVATYCPEQTETLNQLADQA